MNDAVDLETVGQLDDMLLPFRVGGENGAVDFIITVDNGRQQFLHGFAVISGQIAPAPFPDA